MLGVLGEGSVQLNVDHGLLTGIRCFWCIRWEPMGGSGGEETDAARDIFDFLNAGASERRESGARVSEIRVSFDNAD